MGGEFRAPKIAWGSFSWELGFLRAFTALKSAQKESLQHTMVCIFSCIEYAGIFFFQKLSWYSKFTLDFLNYLS